MAGLCVGLASPLLLPPAPCSPLSRRTRQRQLKVSTEAKQPRHKTNPCLLLIALCTAATATSSRRTYTSTAAAIASWRHPNNCCCPRYKLLLSTIETACCRNASNCPSCS